MKSLKSFHNKVIKKKKKHFLDFGSIDKIPSNPFPLFLDRKLVQCSIADDVRACPVMSDSFGPHGL